ncbi:hypothetical protein [Phytohabitans aurantiacus]|jgi:hypothetical protein|uniref:Uncharacterized protein n=1 Tax=Phytohabitans aurantiacus TaxID=3016789 RepID=A0ABQ5R7S8_9ACTN|nr:hypothetical protein [Phytohabitans aurantiacus]GLI02715.1 hypothetical protein Pa4123_79930 [Phytohabitans aurantiacus]
MLLVLHLHRHAGAGHRWGGAGAGHQRASRLHRRAGRGYCAFDDGHTPIDCAIWGHTNNHADDGDYSGTIHALLTAGALTQHIGPRGALTIDTFVVAYLTTAN